LVHADGKPNLAKYMSICVLPAFMDEVSRHQGEADPLGFGSFDSKYSYFLLEALDALIHEVSHHGDSSPLMLASLENRIAIQLTRDGRAAPHWRIGSEPHIENVVQQACIYIETYYTSNITVKDISDAIFVSPSYLQKIFPRIVGKTPHQYILECRHRKACGLLVKTRISMEEVARQCGFVSSSHFSTTFKQVEGVSPLAYRKVHLQQQ
jgi:AraC-like DNA-binding protein